jgi:pimeloyl-ACP methyl ester carboxylesterase
MEPRIQAVASCSAFADPKALTLDFLRMMHVPSRLFARPVVRFIEQWLGTTMDSVAPRNCIRRIDAPLLLIHGEADSFIPPSNMHTLCAEAREHAEQLLIPGRGHSDVLRDARCSQGIVAFLGRALLAADDQAAPLIGLSLQEMGAEAL